jgi:hypothetical protein
MGRPHPSYEERRNFGDPVGRLLPNVSARGGLPGIPGFLDFDQEARGEEVFAEEREAELNRAVPEV